MSVHAHAATSPKHLKVAVLTVSDTRTPETDRSGSTLKSLLEGAGHSLANYDIVPDDMNAIQGALIRGLQDPGTEVIIITGGTGVSPRDVTIEVVEGLLDKSIPGFGEIFRMLSFEEIGPAAIASRATAGFAQGTLIFATPGSTGAVRLAMNRLILPEMGHLIGQSRRKN